MSRQTRYLREMLQAIVLGNEGDTLFAITQLWDSINHFHVLPTVELLEPADCNSPVLPQIKVSV